MAPFDYLMARPGKNFRRQVLAAFNVWLQVDEVAFNIIDRVVEMLHNASLLSVASAASMAPSEPLINFTDIGRIDDIQDGSKFRRGFPSAHVVFGIAQTINSANYVYFIAQNHLLGLNSAVQAIQIFNEELINLHRGQGMELFWRDTRTVPSEEDYYQMISNKTGGLFRLAARLLQSASSTTHDTIPLADTIGLIFQIRDDYQNLSSTEMAADKGYCEDLTEGKFSFPVVHALRSSSSCNNELLQILNMHTEDNGLKAHAVWYMQTVTHSFDYTRYTLRNLHEQAQVDIKRIKAGNDLINRVIGALELK
ncbi:MAG: hypothetical protein Q9177_006265 [Variospora cf. flavescens]